ncbi:MAG: universal stress protein [ANME-2 cluster archaeon]|nr:universal stress protein [ANME-2 cluster archaeon]
MVKKIQLLVDSSPDSDVTAMRAVSVASHLDAVIVATEIRDTRRFDSYSKSEKAKQLFGRKLERISDLAADRGVEICDDSSKAVADQSKDILKVAGHIHPNVVVSSALDSARRVGLSDRAAELFKYSKHNLLLVKDPQHDASDFQNILVSADSPFDISDYTADFAERYKAKLTAVKVVDLEEGMISARPVYLSEVSSSPAPGMPRRQLGDTIKTSETLLTKMKESGIRRGQAMADAVANVARDRGVNVETKVLIGKRDDELANFTKQQQIDLLMLGSDRENLVKRLMHKTAPESIVRKVDSSVFAVRKVA